MLRNEKGALVSLETVLADRKNLAFAGTLVTAGQGEGVVWATGDKTETGRIAWLIGTKAGVGGAVIISAGFKECGKPGVELERQVFAEALRGKLRLIGPNCLGVMVPQARLNATFAEGIAEPGNVAFLSQSGARCAAVPDWSYRENVGFSAFVSVGSMLDAGWGDLITYLGDDPQAKPAPRPARNQGAALLESSDAWRA